MVDTGSVLSGFSLRTQLSPPLTSAAHTSRFGRRCFLCVKGIADCRPPSPARAPPCPREPPLAGTSRFPLKNSLSCSGLRAKRTPRVRRCHCKRPQQQQGPEPPGNRHRFAANWRVRQLFTGTTETQTWNRFSPESPGNLV